MIPPTLTGIFQFRAASKFRNFLSLAVSDSHQSNWIESIGSNFAHIKQLYRNMYSSTNVYCSLIQQTLLLTGSNSLVPSAHPVLPANIGNMASIHNPQGFWTTELSQSWTKNLCHSIDRNWPPSIIDPTHKLYLILVQVFVLHCRKKISYNILEKS